MSVASDLVAIGFREAAKLISGKLLTDAQIQTVTKNVVGQYFAEFFPTPQKEAEAEARINNAK